MNRSRAIWFCLILCLTLGPLQRFAAAQAQTSAITIDAAAPGHPFPHFWEHIFGSGRANLSLRESYRDDLRSVKRITDFGYVRFHGILMDENGVYSEDAQGRPVYDFSYVDQIYDGLLQNGVRPFVELSFMPKATRGAGGAARFLVQARTCRLRKIGPNGMTLFISSPGTWWIGMEWTKSHSGISKFGTSPISIFGSATPSRPSISSCTITPRGPSSE